MEPWATIRPGNTQWALSVGEGKGTSWMGELEINIFTVSIRIQRQPQFHSMSQYSQYSLTFPRNVPKYCRSLRKLSHFTCQWFRRGRCCSYIHLPPCSCLLPSNSRPVCRTCLPTTSSSNHYPVLKNTNLRMKTDTAKPEKHTSL